jgi:hypothetical protein
MIRIAHCRVKASWADRRLQSDSMAHWIMSPSKPRAAKTVDLALAVPHVAETLRSERFLKTASLAKAGIPKAQQSEAIESLLRKGSSEAERQAYA